MRWTALPMPFETGVTREWANRSAAGSAVRGALAGPIEVYVNSALRSKPLNTDLLPLVAEVDQ